MHNLKYIWNAPYDVTQARKLVSEAKAAYDADPSFENMVAEEDAISEYHDIRNRELARRAKNAWLGRELF